MRFLFRLFIWSLLSFILIIALCALIVYLTLSSSPFPVTLNDTSVSAMLNLKENMDNETKSINSTNTDKERKIIFSTQDINSAFNIYLSASQINSFLGHRNSFPEDSIQLKGGRFDDGKFIISLTKKLSFSTPFGKYLNIRFEAVPSIKDNYPDIKISSLNFGSVSVPAFVIDYILNKEKINDIQEVKLLLSAIKKLEVHKDSVTLIYNPNKLSDLTASLSGHMDF
ncbi:MAG TPA: hypothetical protein DD381_07655 [Lentisphaeria bacterium]|nr:MAG: hypothetical protein A2X47_04220 [Lentisphaerae bacterium GWF2_38_69]HBM16197.1 hypothetical protein [Lentisphaeria bacterium]